MSNQNVLDRIAARTREDVRSREQHTSLQTLQAATMPPLRDFKAALAQPGLSLIAEFKPASPSRGALRTVEDAPRFAKLYDKHASAVSVLCDTPFFGGGHHLLALFRAGCQQPLLCKDFILGEYQIWEARVRGADAVLLLVALHTGTRLRELLSVVHELGMHALVEAHTMPELETAIECDAPIIGINSRDLTTLDVNTDGAFKLREAVPVKHIVVAESGIESRAQVDALRGVFDAALIGTTFMTASDPAARIRELGW